MKTLKFFALKYITIAPTCFGFDQNHHQGACELCFAKLLKWYQLLLRSFVSVAVCPFSPVLCVLGAHHTE